MTTASEAYKAIRAIIDAGITVPRRWQNETKPLPNSPEPFIYTEILIDPGELKSYGGGRFRNLYRNFGNVESYAFVPAGVGVDPALALAEQVATLFRSHRDTKISCFQASVMPLGNGSQMKPPGLSSEVGNYYCAVCDVVLFFDQIG